MCLCICFDKIKYESQYEKILRVLQDHVFNIAKKSEILLVIGTKLDNFPVMYGMLNKHAYLVVNHTKSCILLHEPHNAPWKPKNFEPINHPCAEYYSKDYKSGNGYIWLHVFDDLPKIARNVHIGNSKPHPLLKATVS